MEFKDPIVYRRSTSIGADGQLADSEKNLPIDRQWMLRNFSGNIGNGLWEAAFLRLLPNVTVISGSESQVRLGVVVFCPANTLGPFNSDLTRMIAHLTQTGTRSVLLAAGAHATDIFGADEVSESGRRLLDVAARGGSTVGVRGAYSAAMVRNSGFSAVRIIGCPSFADTATLSGASGRRSGEESAKDPPIIQVALHGGYRDPAGALLRLGARAGAHYLVQSVDDPPFSTIDVEWLAGYYAGHAFASEVATWWRAHCLLPRDLREWGQMLRRAPFQVTMRIHGAIAGMREGVPTLFVPTDTRTAELAAYGNLPCASLAEVCAARDLDELGRLAVTRMVDLPWQRAMQDFEAVCRDNGIEDALEQTPEGRALEQPRGRDGEARTSALEEALRYCEEHRMTEPQVADVLKTLVQSSRTAAECELRSRASSPGLA